MWIQISGPEAHKTSSCYILDLYPEVLRSCSFIYGRNDDLCILLTKNQLRFTLVWGVKFWTQIFICVNNMTFCNSAWSMVSKAHIQLAVQAKWALGMGGRPKCWQEAIAPVPKPSMRRRHFRARSQADHQAPPGNGPRMQATPTIPTCTRPIAAKTESQSGSNHCRPKPLVHSN